MVDVASQAAEYTEIGKKFQKLFPSFDHNSLVNFI